MSKKLIVVPMAGTELNFEPQREHYGEYIGAMARGDVVDSAYNFIMQSAADDETKTVIRELDDENPGAAMQIAAKVIEKYAPKVTRSVKK
ncbi:putative phage tail assembly chaperone [Enterovibrio sp. ZSDZ42]|uniref:Phage tail assembly chaperone n=1 Tax=Enterovibrio gelatinilyticus TaxID=2899819 RepID=A0ABT5QWW6_9GAMM|nr:putative phage tail assembly chaperone [Enterovibrio sp. ZSDZ42]MDD1792517.1 putative phage tail assembly chaperone [Enterovibrio sp. ZSDZ42]